MAARGSGVDIVVWFSADQEAPHPVQIRQTIRRYLIGPPSPNDFTILDEDPMK
jgi:hypothetical protein